MIPIPFDGFAHDFLGVLIQRIAKERVSEASSWAEAPLGLQSPVILPDEAQTSSSSSGTRWPVLLRVSLAASWLSTDATAWASKSSLAGVSRCTLSWRKA